MADYADRVRAKKFSDGTPAPAKFSDGTPAPVLPVNQTVEALTPDQDFSPTAAARRKLQDQLSAKRIKNDYAEQIAAVEAPDAPVSRVGNVWLANYYKKQADDFADQEAARNKRTDISNYPSTKAIVEAAKAQGATLNDDDIANLIDWHILNDAADTVIAAVKAGDPNAPKNVQLTLEKTNFAAAAILPDLIEEKLNAAIVDPTVSEKIVEKVLGAISWAATPFVAANDWATEGVRAGSYRQQQDFNDDAVYNFGIGSYTKGFFSGADREATAGGNLNEERIQGLRDAKNPDGTPVYTPLQVDIVTELVKLEAEGDPFPLQTLWADKYKGNLEAAKIFGDFAYAYSEGNTQELYRQVQAANLADTGQAILGAGIKGTEYDPAYGTKGRANLADVVGGATTLLYDPTNLAFGGGRAFQAARWALTRLEPTTGSAETVLKAMKIGNLTVQTPATRFFANFTKDLNKVDDLAAKAAAAKEAGDTAKATSLRADAAAVRNRMSRDYDQMPEQLIEDFRKEMPRNADGKFDVQTAAQWIDSTNEAFRVTSGQAAQGLRDIAAADAVKRAALMEILASEDSVAAKAAKRAIDDLDTQTAAKVTEIEEGLQAAYDKTFYSRVANNTETRQLLVPRMSLFSQIRKDAVNAIKVSQIQSKTVDSMIEKNLPRMEDSRTLAEDLNTNAVALGTDVRGYRVIQPVDTVGRMFSSLPDVSVLSIHDASSTRAFYRMARAFLPKRVSQLLAEAWRKGDPGSRRKMVIGLVRSGAAVRGVELSADDAEALVTSSIGGNLKDKVTGLGKGEKYGVDIPGGMLPSEKAAAATAAKKEAKEAAVIDRHPNLNSYRDSGMGGVGDDSSVVGFVNSKFLSKMTGNGTRAEGVAKYAEDLAEGKGFTDPLMVEFDPSNGRIFVGEGNHRLAAAIQSGEIRVPVRVVRSRISDSKVEYIRENGGSVGQVDVPPSPWKGNLGEDYWPSDINPVFIFGEGKVFVPNRAAVTSTADDLGEEVAGGSLSLSADRNGMQHALHMEDTSDYVRIPSMQDFEDLRKEMGLAAQGYYYGGRGMQAATNVWSFLTLYGPRFSLRNAIEEDGLYLAMGGSPVYLAKGRAADQAIRRARPRLSPKTEVEGDRIVPKVINGEVQITRKSSLGMIANKAEWLSLRMKKGGIPDWIAEFVYNSVDTKQAVAAAQQHAAGNPQAFMDLIVQAQVAHKLGQRNLSMLNEDQMKMLQYLAGSQHGMQLYDQIGEASQYLSNGNFPDFVLDSQALDAPAAGVGFGKVKAQSNLKFGDYQNVRPIQVDPNTGQAVLGVSAWWDQLRKTLETDGPIGEAAVLGLGDPAKTKRIIADIIRNDTEFGYKESLSRISDDLSIDEYANSYFENVFQHFTREDGTLNMNLRSKFVYQDPETGQMRAAFWGPSPEDANDLVYRVQLSDLLGMDKSARPQYVFGRAVEESSWIPVAEDEAALLTPTRGFAWMGRQNARISKGPIFLANVMEQWDKSYPLRESLAKQLAESGGREVPDAADVEMAEKLFAKQAMDTAYNLTVSFVDNPANRSNIAWKARNVSRYYRATEDFWRRMKRVAETRPETFWKIGLTYHVLTDTGFVFEDDNGDAYFGYPGSEALQDTVSKTLALIGGPRLLSFMDENPFLLGGKIIGTTPSGDPNQQLPALAGPAAVALTAVYDMFPTLTAMKGLQQLTLGQYASVTGNLLDDVIKAATPAGVTRALNTTNPDQLDASLAQAGMDTYALMAAEGLLEEITINGRKVPGYEVGNAEMFQQSDQYKAGQFIAWGLVSARTILSTFGPANPQLFSNTVSKEARDLGITGMKPLYRSLLEIHKDDPDPYASAISEFMAMQAKKMYNGEQVSMQSFLPFTLSSYTASSDSASDNVAALAKIRTGVDGLTKWWGSAETKDLVRNGYRNAALFLAPQKGDFSFAGWDIIKNDLGLVVKKNEEQMIEDLLALQGKSIDTQIRNTYEELIANIDPNSPTAAEERKQYLEASEYERKVNKVMYPAWALVDGQGAEPYKQANYREAFSQVSNMLNYMRKRDGELAGDAAGLQSAVDIYLYYQSKSAAAAGSAQQKSVAKKTLDAEMQAELINLKNSVPQTKTFIESVIENLTYDPVYPAFGGN